MTEDIQQLSQLTKNLRMYGMACNQTEFVLDAIARTKVNSELPARRPLSSSTHQITLTWPSLIVTIWMGVYIGDNSTVNEQQKSEALEVLQTYGTDHVSGVTVGNEYLLNAVDKTTAGAFILSEVSDVRIARRLLGALADPCPSPPSV